MSGMNTVWAIGLDYGVEGQQPPLTVFADKTTAEASQKLMAANYGTGTYLVEVPFWPNLRED